tara:strand:+ start:393 stop:716 length:324 start_codon:yes stop_codon:yes gene_type:complete
MPVKELFPWDSFPFRLELKDRVAWFQCQEHMEKEIARYNLKPKDYKKSAKRGHKIQKPEKPKNKKKSDSVKPKKQNLKRINLLHSKAMKFETLSFEKMPKLLHPKMK